MIVIWGAGRKGKLVANKLRKEEIRCFIDSDEKKTGNYWAGIKIQPKEYLNQLDKNDSVILTFKDKLVEECIVEWGGNYLTIEELFNQNEIKDKMDDDLFFKYCFDVEIKEKVFTESIENWFRTEPFNELNCELIKAMKEGDEKKVSDILDFVYADGRIAFDTYYSVRPGMRLADRIIRYIYGDSDIKIVDFACGTGELILKLANYGYDVYGFDYSNNKVENLKKQGIKAVIQDVSNTNYDNDFFDVTICMECLEHVEDVVKVVDEIHRVTKKGGIAIITLPYLKNCDCSTHVRQFDEVKLASLFSDRFEIVNIIKMPYLNWTQDDNLFLVARKIK